MLAHPGCWPHMQHGTPSPWSVYICFFRESIVPEHVKYALRQTRWTPMQKKFTMKSSTCARQSSLVPRQGWPASAVSSLVITLLQTCRCTTWLQPYISSQMLPATIHPAAGELCPLSVRHDRWSHNHVDGTLSTTLARLVHPVIVPRQHSCTLKHPQHASNCH